MPAIRETSGPMERLRLICGLSEKLLTIGVTGDGLVAAMLRLTHNYNQGTSVNSSFTPPVAGIAKLKADSKMSSRWRKPKVTPFVCSSQAMDTR